MSMSPPVAYILLLTVFSPPFVSSATRAIEAPSSSQVGDGRITVPFHKRITPANSRAQRWSKRANPVTGSVNLGLGDQVFVADVSVGTPPKTYICALETIGSDFYLQSSLTDGSKCPSPGLCDPTGPFYSMSSSSSATNTGATRKLNTTVGLEPCTVVTDVVSFGGFTLNSPLSACDLMIDFTPIPSVTGIFGLGYTANDVASNSTPFVRQLADSNQLAEPLFAIAFAPEEQNTNGTGLISGGIMTLGFLNNSFYSGEINYINFTSDLGSSVWTIPIEGISLNGQNLNQSTDIAVIDTGDPGFLVPTAVADAIYSSIPGSVKSSSEAFGNGLYSYPCSETVQLTFTIAGTPYKMASSSFNQKNLTSDTCQGAVIDGGSDIGLWTLGTAFLQSYYTVFRFTPPSMAFATLLDPSRAIESNPLPTLSGVDVSETSLSSSVSQKNSASHVGPIVGGVVGGLAFCAVVALSLFFWHRKNSERVVKQSADGDEELNAIPTKNKQQSENNVQAGHAYSSADLWTVDPDAIQGGRASLEQRRGDMIQKRE